MRTLLTASFPVTFALLTCCPATALAYGESVDGFPNWAERVDHQWANRARAEPQTELQKCIDSGKCPDSVCYKPKEPLYGSEMLGRAARYHSSEMKVRNFFAHDSNCALDSSLKGTYPDTCIGEVACACVGGKLEGTTGFGARVGIWTKGASGEIIASTPEPNNAFYLWLHEPTSDPSCKFTLQNGHRWLLLTGGPAVGFGADGKFTGDFGPAPEKHKIASGAHYPQSGASVELWASWFDQAGPSSALVNLGGTCSPMSLERGSETNGAYLATAKGLSGCVRYYFLFTDSSGAEVTYPSTGSLGIGSGTCSDWSPERPTAGDGCGDTGAGGTGGSGQGGSGQGGTSGAAGKGGASGGSGGSAQGGSSGSSGQTGAGGSTAGSSSGGSSSGGTSSGGTSSGGTSSGGSSAGGTSAGGNSSGGTSSGGASNGGSSAAGNASGGTTSGGSGGATASGGKGGAGTSGTSGQGGTTSNGSAGKAAGGSGGATDPGATPAGGDSEEDAGCACGVPVGGTSWGGGLGLALGLLALASRRRRG